MERLSLAQARRVALAAQGLAKPPASAREATDRTLRATIERIGALQLDSVNVVARAHEITLHSRVGPYDRSRPWGLQARGALFEYWGHEASLLPVDLQPLFRWRMADARAKAWPGLRKLETERPGYVEGVLAEVTGRGPLTAADLERPGGRTGPWWGWNEGKRALELLFWTGQLTARRRYPSFERVYDLPERVLPSAVLARPTPAPADAQRELLAIAGRCLGVAGAGDLIEYFRLPAPAVRPLLHDLVDDGRLLRVAVEGWDEVGYLAPGAVVPRPSSITAATLLSPFDPLLWSRPRMERLFGFRFRIELYTPAPQRVHGYYVLPFLLGDRIVARVDVKADRKAATLVVPAAWLEPGTDEAAVVLPLRDALLGFARWLGLAEVAVGQRGDLAHGLANALSARR